MKKSNSRCNALSRMGNILVLLMLLTTLHVNTIYAQICVSLPLNDYSNNGTQLLTPSITVPSIQFVEPNIGILLDNNPLPEWLTFETFEPNSSTLRIDFKVPAGKCVPRPSGKTDCGTQCGSAINPDYNNAAISKCYTLSVTAYGNTYTHYLCVYGDPVLSISPAAGQGFDQQTGNPVQKTWKANRDNNLLWTLTPGSGVNPDYMAIETGTEIMEEVKLIYNPSFVESGTYTLKLSGINPHLTNIDVCDPPQSTTVNVNAYELPDNEGKKVDLVLVLDISGSMGEKGACTEEQGGTFYNPDDFDSKLGFVRTNLKGVLNKIKEIGPAPGSRIGVVTFTTNSEKRNVGGRFFNEISENTISDINSLIESLTPQNMTNMGAGLHDAIGELENSTAEKKQIILVTNGMQNQNPMVRRAGSINYIDLNNNSNYDANEEIPRDIQIFAIAIFQPSNDYLNLLKAISGNNSRFIDICTLNQAIDEAFETAYTGNSPKMVGSRNGNFSANTAIINYSLSENEFDKILVSVSSTRNTDLSLTFEKNVNGTWTDITGGGVTHQVMPNYMIYSIAGLPKVVNGINITPSGEYRVVAGSSVSDADYYSSAIVDNRGLKKTTFIESKTIRAGDSFTLSTSLRYNTDPVHMQNATVKAVIHRPVASFEKLMAKEKVPGDKVIKSPFDREKQKSSMFKIFSLDPADGCTFESGLPLIEQKYQLLVYEKGFLGKLVFETDTVPLPEITNGIYQAEYNNTKVSGLYDVEYLINGTLPVTGNFFRTSSHSTPVLFGIPDRPKSDFYLFDEGGYYFLSLRPVDIYGNYLGMGKADQVSMTMSAGSHRYPLDYLDGHYVIPLNVPADKNPYIAITVGGMDFYHGFLFDIPEKKFFIGLGAGLANPVGTFNTNADPGYMAGLRLGYRFNRKFGILAETGYFSFKNPTGTNSIFGGGAGLFYIPASLPVAGGMKVQLEGTAGYYKPNDIDAAWGLRGGFDLGKYFSTWFSLSFNTSYYRIFTKPDATEFLGISLNAKFHF